MPSFQTIHYSKVQGIASICLNRPHVRNAYNTVMRDELFQVMEAVREDTEVTAVVISGRGPGFCAGADLTEFGTAPSIVIAKAARSERDLWGLFLNIGKPLVAAIHGQCIGSGLEMAMLCDLRIAAADAVFAMPEVKLGLIPAAGGTQTLPRYLGLSRSLHLLLIGHPIDAEEALAHGLVTKVVPRSQLTDDANGLAQHLTTLDQVTISALKKAMRDGQDLSLDQALELETRLVLKLLSGKSRYQTL